MNFKTSTVFGAVMHVALVASSAGVFASNLEWTVDSTASSYTFHVATQTVNLTRGNLAGNAVGTAIVNQTNASPWNIGNSTAISGMLTTDYVDGQSIQFTAGQTQLIGVQGRNLRANPAVYSGGTVNPDGTASGGSFTDTSTAAAYGFRLLIGPGISFNIGSFGLRDVHYELSSALLSIDGGGNFTLDNGALAGMSSALVARDGNSTSIIYGDVFPDAIYQQGSSVASELSAGTITAPDPINHPFLRMLTLPIASQAITLNLGDGMFMTGTATGMLVATATVPEPSSLALAGLGLVAGIVCLAGKRRRR